MLDPDIRDHSKTSDLMASVWAPVIDNGLVVPTVRHAQRYQDSYHSSTLGFAMMTLLLIPSPA